MKTLEEFNSSIAHLELYSENPIDPNIQRLGGWATGFIWKWKSSFFLITNWHVLAQRNHDTGIKFQQQQAEERYVKIQFPHREPFIEPLYEGNKIRWLQDSKKKINSEEIPETDIAILPISKMIENDAFYAFNDILEKNKARRDLHFEVTMPLSIIGYPLDFEEGLCWVTGKVAQPPNKFRKIFLLNAYPYGGMSGAPVLWTYPNRPIKLENGSTMDNSISGTFIQFAGIYSGRMYDKYEKTLATPPLARIWSPTLIEEIFSTSLLEMNSVL